MKRLFSKKEVINRKERGPRKPALRLATQETLLVNRSVFLSSLSGHVFLLLMFHPAHFKQLLESEVLPSLKPVPLFFHVRVSDLL